MNLNLPQRSALCLVALAVLAIPLAAEDHLVRVLPDNTFEPRVLTIALGDSVTWTNEGGLHNVRGPGFRCANGCDDDGMGGDGAPATNDWSFTITFDEEGTVNYFCEVHIAVDMVGSILVGEPTELSLEVDGVCPLPGATSIEIDGLPPLGEFAIMRSDSLGSALVPPAGGVCEGTPVDLEDPVLVARFEATPVGTFSITRDFRRPVCGQFMQVLDLTDCDTTEAVQVPRAEDSVMQLEQVQISRPLSGPIEYTHAGDGSGWLFIAERPGRIKIYDGDDIGMAPFLDIRDRVNDSGLSQGLLGLGFHPDYESNGFFYMHYTNFAGDSVISRFSVTGDPRIADPDSEAIILQQPQPDIIHQGGPLFFGEDGYLYVGMGDGGPVSDPHDQGQELMSLLGKILRLDVDSAFPYAIPPDNPFVGDPDALDEIWAYGLRNPWKVSVDSLTQEIYISDVGNGGFEEVNLQPADSPGGDNYGWSAMEGPECFDPPTDCNPDGTMILPEISYRHFEDGEFIGCAIIGGSVYRGVQFPGLVGKYVYSDWCSGQIWTAERIGDVWDIREAFNTSFRVTAFGVGEDGEIYVGQRDGDFFRLVRNPFLGGATDSE